MGAFTKSWLVLVAKNSLPLMEVIDMLKNIIIAVLACITITETMYIKEIQGYMKAAKIFVESNLKEEAE